MCLWKQLFKVYLYPLDFFFLHFIVELEPADIPVKMSLHSKTRERHANVKNYTEKKWMIKENLYFSLNESTLFSEQSALWNP